MSRPYAHDLLVLAIPAYNEAKHIAETIGSVKAQTWTDFVAIITDNASTDQTEAICRRAIERDPRFFYVRQPENLGASANFNWALDKSQSPFFMWLGAHDLIGPEFLAGHLQALRADRRYSLSYSLTQEIDETGVPIRVSDSSFLGDIHGGPLQRFFGSIRRMNDCTAINNVLRREAIGPSRLGDTAGCDKVMLSSLLFWGPAHRVDRPQYFRRRVAGRTADYMERLTGRAGVAKDDREMINLYLETFDELVGWTPSKLTRPLVRSVLERRYIRPFRKSDWFHVLAMKLLMLQRNYDPAPRIQG